MSSGITREGATPGSEGKGENVTFISLRMRCQRRWRGKLPMLCGVLWREICIGESPAKLRLIAFDQSANALRIGLAMAVTGDGIRTAAGFYDDF